MKRSHRPRIFATCPQSSADADGHDYLTSVRDVARWSEDAGCEGILVYTDNSLVDPWLTAQVIIEHTTTLCPLVAVQPVYMHPYTAAKMVATFGHVYGRRVWLNMLAGGFRNDLTALGDATPHDERYERTVEYAQIMLDLFRGERPVTLEGRYYTVSNLHLSPRLPASLHPGTMVSGSSPAGLAAARALDALAVQYPGPPGQVEPPPHDIEAGFRIGIIARADADLAWAVAGERFPADRTGQMTHRLATAVSDSQWHRQLAELGDRPASELSPYWLGPFHNYKTFCPYLVGSYDQVADELASYLRLGARTFVLDIPASRDELEHIATVFERTGRRSDVLEDVT